MIHKPRKGAMISYDFDAIRPHTISTVYYGSLAGCILGYYITLAKTPYFIFMDCVYGALLGSIFAFAFSLLAQYVQFEPKENLEARKNLTGKALYLFLKIAKRTSNKKLEQYCLSALRQMGITEAPISSRTRSKTRE